MYQSQNNYAKWDKPEEKIIQTYDSDNLWWQKADKGIALVGAGWGEMSRKDYKGTEETLRGDEYVHDVDCGNDMCSLHSSLLNYINMNNAHY